MPMEYQWLNKTVPCYTRIMDHKDTLQQCISHIATIKTVLPSQMYTPKPFVSMLDFYRFNDVGTNSILISGFGGNAGVAESSSFASYTTIGSSPLAISGREISGLSIYFFLNDATTGSGIAGDVSNSRSI